MEEEEDGDRDRDVSRGCWEYNKDEDDSRWTEFDRYTEKGEDWFESSIDFDAIRGFDFLSNFRLNGNEEKGEEEERDEKTGVECADVTCERKNDDRDRGRNWMFTDGIGKLGW